MIAGARSRRAPEPDDEVIDADGHGARPAARQRPHPRGDDAVPRLRRRHAADASGWRRRSGPPRRSSRPTTSTGGRASPAWRWCAAGPSASGTCTGTAMRRRGRSRTPGCGAVIGAPLIDAGPGGAAALRESAERSLELLARCRRRGSRRRSLRTRSTRSARTRCAGSPSSAAEHELPVHIHLSETEQEVSDCVGGARPAPSRTIWTALGLLSAADAARPRRLARRRRARPDRRARRDRGHEPGREHEAGGRRDLPLPAGARARDSGCGLGTDGAGSNNSLDLLADAKHFALVQKHAAADPAAVTAAETLAIATGAQAPLLGELGPNRRRRARRLPARRARISPSSNPGDLTANLVYAASGAVVDTTVVAGQGADARAGGGKRRGGRTGGACASSAAGVVNMTMHEMSPIATR